MIITIVNNVNNKLITIKFLGLYYDLQSILTIKNFL